MSIDSLEGKEGATPDVVASLPTPPQRQDLSPVLSSTSLDTLKRPIGTDVLPVDLGITASPDGSDRELEQKRPRLDEDTPTSLEADHQVSSPPTHQHSVPEVNRVGLDQSSVAPPPVDEVQPESSARSSLPPDAGPVFSSTATPVEPIHDQNHEVNGSSIVTETPANTLSVEAKPATIQPIIPSSVVMEPASHEPQPVSLTMNDVEMADETPAPPTGDSLVQPIPKEEPESLSAGMLVDEPPASAMSVDLPPSSAMSVDTIIASSNIPGEPLPVTAPSIPENTVPTAFAAPEPAQETYSQELVAVLTKAQHKWATGLVRTLKKHRSSPPFLRPVDPVALNIPDYLTIITNPTDLGTIDNKLTATGRAIAAADRKGRIFGLDYNEAHSGVPWEGASANVYRTLDEFSIELERVWENCFKYNGPRERNPVAAMAGQLKDISDKAFLTAPAAPAIKFEPGMLGEPSPEPVPPPVKKEARRQSGGYSHPRRTTEEVISRPKREPVRDYVETYNPPPPKRVSNRAAQDQTRFCKEVMKEMFKKAHESFAYPFYAPVDTIALGIPHYNKIVKRPMDLGTVKSKVDAGLYPSPPFPHFEADMRQIFTNCYLFNPPGSAVYTMGKRLEAIWEEKWAERPHSEEDPAPAISSGYGMMSGGMPGMMNSGIGYEGDIASMERQIQMMAAHIEMIKANQMVEREQALHADLVAQRVAAERAAAADRAALLEAEKSARAAEKAAERAAKARAPPKKRGPAPSNTRKRSSTGPSSKKKKKGRYDSDEDDDWDTLDNDAGEPEELVTFEMKRDLATKIVAFDGEMLERAIEIIRQGRPELLTDANQEIELDIDQLDQNTLWNLYQFVCPNGRRGGGGGINRKPKGPSKRKNLDEIKETERIEMLEKRLREFDNGGSTATTAPPAPAPEPSAPPAVIAPTDLGDVASSDSSSSDSDSDSDED